MVTQASWSKEHLDILLRERFHITTGFHPGQVEVIQHLLQGQRLLAIQHTGWGKSLCYQFTSICTPHMTLVFSPLKALMRDQWRKCNHVYGIPSAIISSDFSREENKTTLVKAITQKIKILFIAPERLDTIDWQRYFQRMKISLLVIDEAHCISSWGHNFRPHYRRIVHLINTLTPHTPVLALTATANQRVEHDIQQQLGSTHVLRGPLRRPNLHLNIVQLHGDWEKLCYLAQVLQKRTDTGIIYAATQSGAMMIATFLQNQGIKAEYYHGGRSNENRQKIEYNLLTNRYNVICSTNALGMGLDKPDIRFVIHYHTPGSIIDYYQEIGRAGRDRNIAWCILLYDPADLAMQQRRIKQDKPKDRCYEAVLTILYSNPQGASEQNLVTATNLSRTITRVILADLLDQSLIQYDKQTRTYTAYVMPTPIVSSSQTYIPPIAAHSIDYTIHEHQRRKKQDELEVMQEYIQTRQCYMVYLINYLGDRSNYPCGVCKNCRNDHFPPIKPTPQIQTATTHFLEEEFLPAIAKHAIDTTIVHQAGWALGYLKGSRIGQQIYACKYGKAGPFSLRLVLRAAEIAKSRYPLTTIHGIVSIPSAKHSMLVDMFARQVAEFLHRPYLPVLQRIRDMQPQKDLLELAQKILNVQNAFAINPLENITGCTLLLIDDIYDSGCTFREVSQILLAAGAHTIYPLIIARTLAEEE